MRRPARPSGSWLGTLGLCALGSVLLAACASGHPVGRASSPVPAAKGNGSQVVAGPAKAWTLQPIATPSADTGEFELEGVSCSSSTACTAVGAASGTGGQPVTVAERWNGSGWSAQTPANPPGAADSSLSGVDCVNQDSCLAVGAAFESLSGAPSNADTPLAEQWNGSSWSVLPTPAPADAVISDLSAISCAASGFCMAVGSYSTGPSNSLTLAEQWQAGAWSILSSPNATNSKSSYLSDVSCVAANFCIAVGHYGASSSGGPLAELWNGRDWSLQTSPSAPAGSGLVAVSCSGDSACEALGGTASGATFIAQRWNGVSWSKAPIGSPGVTGAALYSMSCTAASSCVAVGSNGSTSLVESWDGSDWSVGPQPTAGSSARLDGISCPGAGVCEAIGFTSGTAVFAERYSA